MKLLEYEHTQETKTHGNLGFPFNIYPCSIPVDFASVPLHWHNDMEIIYIKKGTGLVSVDLEPYTVHMGDIILVCPGQLHSIAQLEEETMEYENFIFQLSMLMTPQGDLCTERYFYPLLHNQITLPSYIDVYALHYKALTDCLDRIEAFNTSANMRNALAIKSCLFELFFLLFSHYGGVKNTKSKNKSMDSLKIALKYVETHFYEKITIEHMAGICGFSPSHFMKFFKNNMGIPFIEYLNDYRLSMASHMLCVSSDSIIRIAEETGFDNLSYFNRIFKRKYGVTPSKFRNNEQPYSIM